MTPTVLQDIPLTELKESPWNPRRHFAQATLDDLAESIRAQGVIEPIVVRANGRGFEILAGSRRFRASKIAGLVTMPAVVRVLDDTAALELSVTENLQREDVHPLDEAEGYQALLKAEKAYNVAIVAAKVGKSESYVYRRLQLLKLGARLQTALAEDRLSVAHAEKLLRLSPALREIAADSVVWRQSPLLEHGEDWIPQREDLRPLHELEHFIRTRSHFDPNDRDVKHFQPELAAAIAAPVETDEDQAAAPLTVIELSVDPMVRMKLSAGPADAIPLSPSKWRAVKGLKDRCAFVVRGVVTHGGPSQVLDVCIKKSCARHFPPVKKAKPSVAAASHAKSEADRRAQEQREREKRQREEEAFKAMSPALCAAMAEHLAKVKVNAAFVRAMVDPYRLQAIKKYFGVTLTDATAAQVLALEGIHNPEYRYHMEAAAKTWDFDLKAFQKRWQAEQDANGKAALKEGRAALKAKGAKKGGK